MKKGKLIATLCSLVLTLACLTFGVYSAVKTTFTASGTITFNAYGLDVLVEGTITNAVAVDDTFTSKYYGATLSDHGDSNFTENVGNGNLPNWAMGAMAFNELDTTQTNETARNTITIELKVTNYSEFPIAATPTLTFGSDVFTSSVSNNVVGLAKDSSATLTIQITPKSLSTAISANAVNLAVELAPYDYTSYYTSLGYTLLENGVDGVTITDNKIVGKQNEYGEYDVYSGKIKKVIIPEGVTAIGDNAFWMCANITDIAIPSSVTSIGYKAFYYSSLTSVSIPSSVTTIGEQAFSTCLYLKTAEISEGVISIGDSAFSECSDLVSVSIPASVKTIGENVFAMCDNLTSISIPQGVTSVDNQFVYGCSELATLTIPSSVKTIGDRALAYCSVLTSINFLGTKAQWNAITFGSDWNTDTGAYTIHCTDGDIAKA